MIPPLEFISIAEESGMIRDIGEWVIWTACKQIASWRDSGLAPVRIAVNVSPSQFREKNFTATVAGILDNAKVEPDMLELEITEGSVMGDAEEAICKLKEFRDMGLRLAIDDFGTGYSSLNYLRRLPIHALKIDQSFIKGLSEEHDTRAIVSATIILAHKLGLEVTAEGVETEEQKQLLRDMQCDWLQGYLIGEPISAERFTAQFLRKNFGETSSDPDHSNSRRASSR
jgi:EAL domain-containing protein (putative c-di-GMP-specific phosphodiesterase class I)